jgi:dUTP pyrophosphatase
MEILVSLNDPNAKPPQRQKDGDAGYDLFSSVNETIYENSRKRINTHISVAIPNGYYGRILGRSSIALNCIDVGAGVIDSGYRGEIDVLLINNSDTDVKIKSGERIAQLVIMKHETPIFKVVDKAMLDNTDRGSNGFGSTGKY